MAIAIQRNHVGERVRNPLRLRIAARSSHPAAAPPCARPQNPPSLHLDIQQRREQRAAPGHDVGPAMVDQPMPVHKQVHQIHVDAGAHHLRRPRQRVVDRACPDTAASDRSQYHRWKLCIDPAIACSPPGVIGLVDPPKPGGRLLQPVVPREQHRHRRIDRTGPGEPMAPHRQQKAAEIDDVVPLLPGIAQIAVGEPGFQRQRIEIGHREVEHRDARPASRASIAPSV